MMKAKTYCINKGTKAQYFGLKIVDSDGCEFVAHVPNNWKTENGAIRWAVNHGFSVVK